MPKQNGASVAAEERRHRVMQMKMSGAPERLIAQQVGVSRSQVWKDVRKRLSEVRRDDAEAVQREWNLQNNRYGRLLMRWWGRALDADDAIAGPATDRVMGILRRIDEISGIIPEKPLIDMRSIHLTQGEVTFSIEAASADNDPQAPEVSQTAFVPETTSGDIRA